MQIALGGNVGAVVEALAKQFATLDAIINTTKANVRELGSTMGALTAEGREAAAAWKEAAAAMQQAARAARSARGAGAGAGAGSAAPRAAGGAGTQPVAGGLPALAYLPRGRQPSPGGQPISLPYVDVGNSAIVPYAGGTGGRGGGYYLPGPPNGGSALTGDPYVEYLGRRPYRGFSWPPGGGVGGGGMPPAGGGTPLLGGPQPPPFAGGTLNSPWGRYPAMPGLNGLAVIPSWMGGDFLKGVFERTAAFDAVRAGLLAQGFTVEQANEAADAAFSTQRSTIGTSALGNIDLVSKLMAVVQDPNEAIKLMPEFARLGVVLNATGHGAEGTELMDAIRAGEFRGVLTKKNPLTGQNEVNSEGLSRFLQEIVATNILSHGQVGPAQILQFLRSAGSAGALIDDKELFARTVALQMAMGSGRAGRSLQGFEQQFAAGRMSEATANLLIEMGIIQGGGTAKTNRFLRKNGIGQFLMMPGAMSQDMQLEAFNSPVAFTMEHLFPRLKAFLYKNYGTAYDNADDKTRLQYETAMATQLASRIPGGTELAEIIRNVLIIGRDTGAFDKAMGRDAYDIALRNNPQLREAAFGASWNAFETSLGQTAMPQAIHALDGLTQDLNALSVWSSQHAEATRIGLEGLTGAVLGLGAAGVIAILGTLGGTTGLLAGVGAGLVIFFNKLTDIQRWLHNHLPSGWYPDPDDDKQMRPWRYPPPGGKPVNPNAYPNPDFSPGHSDIQHYYTAPNGVPTMGPLFGPQSQSYAPTGGASAGGASSGPVPVVVTNGRDLIRGVSDGQAGLLNRPQSGYSGSDPLIDPSAAFYGTTPP